MIDILFPNKLEAPAEILARYPKRNLPEGAMVTRIAPSPTGFMHIGTLYTAMVSERFAHQTAGVFMLRTEDTDKKREVEGAGELVVEALDYYGIRVDEGQDLSWKEIGNYGPYKQSNRQEIYASFVKDLVEKWLAYPCFCSSEELEEIRKTQEEYSQRPGYYGQWAKWRNATSEDIQTELDKKTPFVIRLRSTWNYNKKIKYQDLLKWTIETSENDMDIVIMKADWLPTYHFAHVVDDYLMGTTDVIRWDEWLASTPLHIQMFATMGWLAPRYGHLAPIQKLDNGNKRKLSKRKDPEASMTYYDENGYTKESILEYLTNLANSDFEDWRKANLDAPITDFKISFERLGNSSWALFDFVKLDNISKEIISRMTSEEIYTRSLVWAEKFDTALASLMKNNKDKFIQIFSIERNGEKTRKDIGKWSDVKWETEYFFDEWYSFDKSSLKETYPNLSESDISNILNWFKETYDSADSKEIWFEKVKALCDSIWFASNIKEYKKAPENFKGSIVEVTTILRLFLTGKTKTPDMYYIMQVLWKEKIFERLSI